MMAKRKVNFPKYLIYKTPKDKIIKILKSYSSTIPKLRFRKKSKIRNVNRILSTNKK